MNELTKYVLKNVGQKCSDDSIVGNTDDSTLRIICLLKLLIIIS